MKSLIIFIILLFCNTSFAQQKDNLLKIPDSSKLNHFTVWSKADSIKYYKSPGTATTYSLVVPGLALGQLYNGNIAGWGIRTLISGLCVGAYFIARDTQNAYALYFSTMFVFGATGLLQYLMRIMAQLEET